MKENVGLDSPSGILKVPLQDLEGQSSIFHDAAKSLGFTISIIDFNLEAGRHASGISKNMPYPGPKGYVVYEVTGPNGEVEILERLSKKVIEQGRTAAEQESH